MTPEGPKHVCHTCIGDEFLAKQVEKEGTQAECTYCHATRPAFTLADLSRRIYEVVKDHFTPIPEYDVPEQLRQGLYDNKTLIEKVAGLKQDIAVAVREYLLKERAWRVDVDREEKNAYSDEFLYEEREADTSDLRSAWWDLKEEYFSHARLCKTTTVATLDRIFGNLASLRTIRNKPVIREINQGDRDSSFWRGRTAHSEPEVRSILKLKDLSSRLDPPPSEEAKAGRMNAKGIPVFYGALEEETCVSEVRAPVGGFVILAKFDLLNPVRVLDFKELSSIYSDFRHFDPNYIEKRSRERFLEELAGEISKPIMPHEEAREYIATQIVSEYLANQVELRLHGIIFNSSQTGGTGHNIVLFNGARSVEAYEPQPGTDLRLKMPVKQGIPPPGTNSSQDLVIQSEPQRAVEETDGIKEEHAISDPETQGSRGDSLLRLDPQSLKVLAISGVKYKSHSVPLNRDYHVSASAVEWSFHIPPAKGTVYRRNQDEDQEPEEESVQVDP